MGLPHLETEWIRLLPPGEGTVPEILRFNEPMTYEPGQETFMEHEAYWFALAVLMPESDLREAIVDVQDKKTGLVNVAALAAKFGVTGGSVINRGRWLGLLRWA